MSKRKGLSLEEKREKVLEVFTDSADVFVLKVRNVQQLLLRQSVDTATGCLWAPSWRVAGR